MLGQLKFYDDLAVFRASTSEIAEVMKWIMSDRDEWKRRAEAAEARLMEWETAANNNDPYVTNGGYVEVEVLEAVKRRNSELLTRAEAAERERDSLRERLQATDARAEGWRTGRDTLRAACQKHRQRIAELEAQLGAVPVEAVRFCVDAASYTYDAVVGVADEWLKTLEVKP